MRLFKQAERAVVDGEERVVVAHVIERFCMSCGFDLDESELEADQCSDCGEPLSLKENVKLLVTSTPLSGATM